MKKKKFITPKVRVIKLAAEELLAAGSGDTQTNARFTAPAINHGDDNWYGSVTNGNGEE